MGGTFTVYFLCLCMILFIFVLFVAGLFCLCDVFRVFMCTCVRAYGPLI